MMYSKIPQRQSQFKMSSCMPTRIAKSCLLGVGSHKHKINLLTVSCSIQHTNLGQLQVPRIRYGTYPVIPLLNKLLEAVD